MLLFPSGVRLLSNTSITQVSLLEFIDGMVASEQAPLMNSPDEAACVHWSIVLPNSASQT